MAKTQVRPYDQKGHFVSLECPNDNCVGKLVRTTERGWACDGLAYPKLDTDPLYVCDFYHIDGEPYQGKKS